ncbi:MAG: type II toxin-antitoxin system VapC family toxin [Gemmataceae bacterium]
MSDWSVDSSVVVKWVLAETDSAQALRVVADTLANGGHLFVLDLALVEVTNAIWTRYHRHLLSLAEARQALALLQQAPVQTVAAVPLLNAAFDIAAQFDMAVYDALFVAAARHLGVGGVTADEPLVRAVGNASSEIKLLRNW